MSDETKKAMDDLITKVKDVHGRIPNGITDMLQLISDPAVIDATWHWLEESYTDIDADDQENHESSIQSGLGGYYA